MDADALKLPSGHVRVEVNGKHADMEPEFWRAVMHDMRLRERIRRATAVTEFDEPKAKE